jgi:hypothetical protein
MPRLSCLQVFSCKTLPEQQLAFALHSMVWSLQMPPAGVHALPASQRPMLLPSSLEHTIPLVSPSGRVADPQQSTSSRQISPVG